MLIIWKIKKYANRKVLEINLYIKNTQVFFFVQGLDAQASDCCVLRKITPLQAEWHLPSMSEIPDLTTRLVSTVLFCQCLSIKGE